MNLAVCGEFPQAEFTSAEDVESNWDPRAEKPRGADAPPAVQEKAIAEAKAMQEAE